MTYNDARIIINGVDLHTRYGLTVTDDTELGVAEPKTYTVDIPGGNGVIDLTDAMAGDAVFDTREITVGLAAVGVADPVKLRTELMGALHGRRLPFAFSFDAGYTYTGRFEVLDFEQSGVNGVKATLKVTADPYKSRGTQAYKLNATGGKLYRFESGRRKVHPTIECEQPCFVTWDGEETIVPAGTYRLNDVVFSQGFNELWVNTKRFFDITWDEIAEGGQFASTWDDLAGLRWDEIHMLGQSTEDVVRSWDDLALTRWSDLTEKHWYDLNYIKNVVGDSTAYLTYEWEDL